MLHDCSYLTVLWHLPFIMRCSMEMYERNEYPRPDFKREVWQNLNGIWEFGFDNSNEGEVLGYQTAT